MKKRFLAMALTLAMVLTAVPMTAFADEPAGDEPVPVSGEHTTCAAHVDGNSEEYESLQKAIEAVNVNGKVILQKNVTENIDVTNGKKFTLDLNGHKLTGSVSNDYVVDVDKQAELTIVNKGGDVASIVGAEGADNASIVRNYGTLKIEDDVSVTCGTNTLSAVKNEEGGNLTITSTGEFKANKTTGSAIINAGVAKITSGTYEGHHPISVGQIGGSECKLTIEGGKFIGEACILGQVGAEDGTKKNGGTLQIDGGEFEAPKFINGSGDTGSANLAIKYDVVINDGQFKVTDFQTKTDLTYCVSVKGGDFTTTPTVLKYLADNANISLKLSSDVNKTIAVKEKTTVELDLNGKKIEVTDGNAIVNKGNLTVKDSGSVSTSRANSAAVVNFPDADCTLKGGTYTSSSWYVIKNMGEMEIKGSVKVVKPDGSTDTLSLIDNGWVDSSDTIVGEFSGVQARANKAVLVIEDGEFECTAGEKSCSVIKNDDYGVLEINGGKFDSSNNNGETNAAAIINWNVATITGGTFIGQYPISNGALEGEADKGTITISGGTFEGKGSLLGYNTNAKKGMGLLTITGGTFEADEAFGTDGTEAPYEISISGGIFSNALKDFISEHLASGRYRVREYDDENVYVKKKSSSSESSSSSSTTDNGKYDVNAGKADNGKIELSTNSIGKDYRVTVTVTPDEGYELDTLIFTDKDGNEIDVEVINNGDGTYSFFMPEGDIKVTPVFKETKPAEQPKKIVMQIGNTTVSVDGNSFTNDTAPVIVGDRTLVPIRIITESLGGDVQWDAETQTVILTIDGKIIAMTIGRILDAYGVAPVIINNRTYVPVRFITDELGAEITWDDITKQITIVK